MESNYENGQFQAIKGTERFWNFPAPQHIDTYVELILIDANHIGF